MIVPLDLADGGKVIWQGTLTPVALDQSVGCKESIDGKRCSNTAILANSNTFTVDGVDHIIRSIILNPGTGALSVRLDQRDGSRFDRFILYVGNTRLPFSNAEYNAGTYSWHTPLSPTVGVPVQLRLIGPPPLEATLESYDTVERKNGGLKYRFDLKLTEPVSISLEDMRDHVFTALNGTIEKATAIDGQRRIRGGHEIWISDHWRLRVKQSEGVVDHRNAKSGWTRRNAVNRERCARGMAQASPAGSTFSSWARRRCSASRRLPGPATKTTARSVSRSPSRGRRNGSWKWTTRPRRKARRPRGRTSTPRIRTFWRVRACWYSSRARPASRSPSSCRKTGWRKVRRP